MVGRHFTLYSLLFTLYFLLFTSSLVFYSLFYRVVALKMKKSTIPKVKLYELYRHVVAWLRVVVCCGWIVMVCAGAAQHKRRRLLAGEFTIVTV